MEQGGDKGEDGGKLIEIYSDLTNNVVSSAPTSAMSAEHVVPLYMRLGSHASSQDKRLALKRHKSPREMGFNK